MTSPSELPIPGYFIKWKAIWEKNRKPNDTYVPVPRPMPGNPNYEFYIAMICLCEQSKIGYNPNYNTYTATDEEEFSVSTCTVCNKLDVLPFKKCNNCDSAFYDLFRHSWQSKLVHYCWWCVNDHALYPAVFTEENQFYLDRRAKGEPGWTDHPPPAYLLAPKVTPQSFDEKMDEIDAIFAEYGF